MVHINILRGVDHDCPVIGRALKAPRFFSSSAMQALLISPFYIVKKIV
jgi:hypothetical protein